MSEERLVAGETNQWSARIYWLWIIRLFFFFFFFLAKCLLNFFIGCLNNHFKFSVSKNKILGEFPGGPVVRTPHSHCQGPGFNPSSGSHKQHSAAKIKWSSWLYIHCWCSCLSFVFWFFFFGLASPHGMWDPQPGIKPVPMAVKAHSPNHWLPGNSLFKNFLNWSIVGLQYFISYKCTI